MWRRQRSTFFTAIHAAYLAAFEDWREFIVGGPLLRVQGRDGRIKDRDRMRSACLPSIKQCGALKRGGIQDR